MSFVIEDVLAIHGVKLKFPVKENVYVDLYVDIALNKELYLCQYRNSKYLNKETFIFNLIIQLIIVSYKILYEIQF